MRDRTAFGAPLFDKQVVRQRLAMLDAKVRAARAYLYHCAWRVTQGHDVVQDVSMLKALTGELVNEVVQGCQQFHGGMGYMRGTAIERLWRDARILAIGGGATEVMLDEAAKRYGRRRMDAAGRNPNGEARDEHRSMRCDAEQRSARTAVLAPWLLVLIAAIGLDAFAATAPPPKVERWLAVADAGAAARGRFFSLLQRAAPLCQTESIWTLGDPPFFVQPEPPRYDRAREIREIVQAEFGAWPGEYVFTWAPTGTPFGKAGARRVIGWWRRIRAVGTFSRSCATTRRPARGRAAVKRRKARRRKPISAPPRPIARSLPS